MSTFFSRLSYSLGNEDWKTEQKALSIQPHDCICCITASGDRPLNLLTSNCQKITCIDANPIQNYLLELKKTAIQHLNYQDYLAFLGAKRGENRLSILKKLLPLMEKRAASFWQKQQSLIEKGVLYQGAAERLTKKVAHFVNFFQGRKIKKLFAYDDLAAQNLFMQKEWNHYFWRTLFKVVLNPFTCRFILKDPGLANIGKTIQPGIYIYERLTASLKKELAKKNLILSLLLKGEVSKEAFSPYLTEEGFYLIQPRLSQLHIQTEEVVAYLESLNGPTFDVFSLSDVVSYINQPNFVRLLKAMLKTAKPGARFCMRQFLSCQDIPTDLKPFFKRNSLLEEELEEQDSCFVYRFSVGVIESMIPVLEEVPLKVKEQELVEV